MKPLTERQIQIQCVSWFRMRYPEASRVFFSTPNAGQRNVWTGKNMRDEGMLAGAADLILLVPRHGFASLCIEMKKIGGRQSDKQKDFEEACKLFKNKYVICYSFDEFKKVCEDYLEK